MFIYLIHKDHASLCLNFNIHLSGDCTPWKKYWELITTNLAVSIVTFLLCPFAKVHVCTVLSHFSRVWLFATLRIVDPQGVL